MSAPTKTAIDLAREVLEWQRVVDDYESNGREGDATYWEAANQLDDFEDAPAIAAQLLSVQERLEKACELLKVIQQCQERGDGLWDVAWFHDDSPYASDFLRKAIADTEAFLQEQGQ